jgi:hypothetical protein
MERLSSLFLSFLSRSLVYHARLGCRHGAIIMIKRIGFPLLICAAFLASSSLNPAHTAPKGSPCVLYPAQCDRGLLCTPLAKGDTTGICCARSEEPRPAAGGKWKCVRTGFEEKVFPIAANCWQQGGVLGKNYNSQRLFCDLDSVCTKAIYLPPGHPGFYFCGRAGGNYRCCQSQHESCDYEAVLCKPWGDVRRRWGR